MMTESVFLYIVPDKQSGDWRAALNQLAIDAGWSVAEVTEDISPQEIVANPKRIWLSENPDHFDNAPIEQCLYTNQPGWSVLDLLQLYAPNEDESHVAGRASHFLAKRQNFRRRGARPLEVGIEQILTHDLPPVKLAAGKYKSGPSYWNHFDSPSCQEVSVPIQALRLGQTRSDRDGSIFDLLGPNRQILAGPHFYVPQGRWKVDLEFAISNIRSPIAFSAFWPHVGASPYDFCIAEDGVYSIEIEDELPEDALIVLSINTNHSVLYGELQVRSLSVTRLA